MKSALNTLAAYGVVAALVFIGSGGPWLLKKHDENVAREARAELRVKLTGTSMCYKDGESIRPDDDRPLQAMATAYCK